MAISLSLTVKQRKPKTETKKHKIFSVQSSIQKSAQSHIFPSLVVKKERMGNKILFKKKITQITLFNIQSHETLLKKEL